MSEQTGKHILVWRFEDAPPYYRLLSDHGGDEDWVAFVPQGFGYVSWLEPGGSFGCCDVSVHRLPSGDEVYIGAHA